MSAVKKSCRTKDILKGTKVVGEQYMLNVCLNSEKGKTLIGRERRAYVSNRI